MISSDEMHSKNINTLSPWTFKNVDELVEKVEYKYSSPY